MKLVINNPYRVIGISANDSAREIQARRGKIRAYANIGKIITSKYDFTFLSSIVRDTEIIDKAFSDIEQNANKVIHSLFWFTNLNPVDNTAIQHLVSGNKEKAIEIWDKLTDGKEVTSKNFSAFNNIQTKYLSKSVNPNRNNNYHLFSLLYDKKNYIYKYLIFKNIHQNLIQELYLKLKNKHGN